MDKDIDLDDEIISNSEEPIIIGSDKFPCPGCGGFMIFSPKDQSLLCSYCGNTVDIAKTTSEVKEYRLEEAEELASHNWGEEKKVLLCKNCSGQTIINSKDVTVNCIFCGSPQVAVADIDEGIRPESMIPFKINNDLAKNNIKKWLKKKFYAPKALKSKQNIEKINSLYIPFFTYDSDSSTAYTGQRGTHYYVTRTKMVNGKRQSVQERRTRWRSVSGVYNNYYNDILINTSGKVDEKLIGKMDSFNLEELEDYNPAYLVGHYAERYSINLNEGWNSAKKIVDNEINQGIRSQVGGDEFRLSSKSTNYGEILFKHILLPVWITSYEYKKNIYNVYINGQTGRVVGMYPKDIIKIILTFLIMGLIILLIYMLVVRYN